MERELAREIISTAQIAREFPYGLRFRFNDPLLEASLEKQGILFPLLLKKGPERAWVISGHKRLIFALAKNRQEVPAVFVQESFSEKELFLLSLYSNWNQNFSELDRMQSLRKAENSFSFSREEIAELIAPALGVEGSAIGDYREVAGLIPEIHLLIHAKKLPFRGSAALARFSKEEQHFLSEEVIPKVHFTTNQILRFSEWLGDLKKIKRATIPDIFSAAEIKEVLSHPKLDARIRGEKLFLKIRTIRFPRITQQEESFLKLKKAVGENEEIQLEHPESFEAEGILLRARLKNREGLKRVLSFLETHRKSFESYL